MISLALMWSTTISRKAIGRWRRTRPRNARLWNGLRVSLVTSQMTPPDAPIRGDVRWVAFDPSIGGEATKTRPAIVVSNDTANRLLSRVQVVALTSNTTRLYPSEASVTVKGERRKAMAHQVTTVSKLRFRGWMARIGALDMAAVDR